MSNTRKSPHKFLLLAASVAGLTMAAATANAQSYAANDGYYDEPDSVTVVGPRYPQRERDSNGRPIRTVSLSKDVSYGDLDLRSDRDADRLYSRIRSTASTLCNDLDNRHPITASNSPPCYSNAVQEAMLQADDAIARARGQ